MPPRFLISPGWPLGRGLALFVSVILVVAATVASFATVKALELRVPADRYNLAAWEARHFSNKWWFELGDLFRKGRSGAERNREILRFFELTNEITRLEQQESSTNDDRLNALHRERDRLENRVEDTIEDRISTVLREQGLTRRLLLFTVVWPPVDFEFTDSPRNLVTSPRDRIELLTTELLRPDLSLAEVEEIERVTERRRNVSALAAPTAGIGAYPSIVGYLSSYERTVEVAAHEWMHNYLFFYPLGFNYYRSNDLRTMNETVADLVGQEIATEVLRRWPLPDDTTPQDQGTADPQSGPALDAGAELRRLRGEVDALLAAGDVDAAESLMETRRLELAAQGFYLRRLNQAYFAFNNLYAGEAGSPAATNPIGPKLDELRRRSSSLADFVALVSRMTSVEELDAALESRP